MTSPQIEQASKSTRTEAGVLDLRQMRLAFESARLEWLAAIAREFPGMSEWHWYRACSAINGENCRRNDDTSHDKALASSHAIKAAHSVYIEKLHAFYRARDGERGFLGGRGA